MRVTLDFHGFTQVRDRPGSDRFSVPLTKLLSGAGVGDDDIIEDSEDMYDVLITSFERRGDRYVCSGCYLCSRALRQRELIDPAVRGAILAERRRVRRRRVRCSRAKRKR